MIYLAMIVLLPLSWFFPWWVLALIAALAGLMILGGLFQAFQFSLGAALINAALAFLKDGQNQGLISKRLAGLFNLPLPMFSFLLVFVVVFVTAFLCFLAGSEMAALTKLRSNSANPGVSNLDT